MKYTKIKTYRVHLKTFTFLLFLLTRIAYCFPQDSSDYVNKGWALRGEKKYEEAYKTIEECITKFSSEADKLAKSLSDFPPKGKENQYKAMNDIATCYFIKGEALRDEGKAEESKQAFQTIVERYPYSQAFDPRGWFWGLKETAEKAINQIDRKTEEEKPDIIEKQTKVRLYDYGSEFPVDYLKYGKFTNVGTKEYKYDITNPIGLAKATGEGVYPNTTSVKFDPEYTKIKKQLFQIDHWKIFNSRDLNTAFYKWNVASESPAEKQFYIAEILERSGLIKQAVKAYYATLVHFPSSYSWTYWHTPWYVAKAAIYRIKYLLKNNPKLKLKLEDADIRIINGYDNNVRNDVFVVNPGRLVRKSFWNRKTKKRKLDKMSKEEGQNVKLVQHENGDWQLIVNNKPFLIKGITYSPTRVGESPDTGTLQNWMTQDINENGIIDAPYESWVDKNKNNLQDNNENIVGDFKLMREMGVNAIRLYYQPFPLDKKIMRELYEEYGIYVMLGDFLGKYALGSGADWEEGTDCDNSLHKKNMLESVKNMVLEFRDEPYILIWIIGNENVYGLGCNADKKPESFFKFANEAALLIKSLDPQNRPIAIASGDTLFLDVFAENCPDIDIFGTNSYRGKYGFLDLWDEVKRTTNKPAMITEYGAPAYAKGYSNEEREAYQADYHKGCWLDIVSNSAGYEAGNAVGGIVFEWIDEWWKAYEPAYHDKKGLFSGPFLDGYMHEEWLGICGQGDGANSPYLRRLRKAYYKYKELWKKK